MATVNGTSGNDIINKKYKDGDGDKLTKGADVVIGGKGNDKLWGLGGKDTFVFKAKSGKDKIMDFTAGKDKIQIKKGLGGIDNAKEALNKAKQLKNGDVVIDLGKGNKITLKDVKLKDLKKSDFDIV